MQNFKYQHGLAIMRAQPFHIGHQKLIDQMLKECALATIAIGSVQEQGTSRNPLDYQTRRQMIQNIYQKTPVFSRLQIIGIYDINNSAQWGNFVLSFVQQELPSAPVPDAYYAGSDYDAQWFKGIIKNICLVNRTDKHFPFVSGTMLRDMIKFHDTRWKNFVAPENHLLIEQHFYQNERF